MAPHGHRSGWYSPAMKRIQAGRRLAAARELAGFKQAELGALVAARGGNKHDVAKIERGQKEMSEAHIDSLVALLHVPREWWTADDLTEWIEGRARSQTAEAGDPAVLADADLAEALSELALAEQRLQHAQELLRRVDPMQGLTGNG